MMAEGPKSTKNDKASDSKAKTSDTSGKAAKGAKGPIEDAEVIGETPPKAAPSSVPAAKAAAKNAADTTAAGGAKPEKATEEPAAKPASASARSVPPTGRADKRTDRPEEKPAEKTADKKADKPAAKPSDQPDGTKSSERARAAAKPEPAQPQKVQKRRSGFGAFLGLVLGGIAAAVIGFVAARTVVPEGWPFPGVEPKEDPLVGVVDAQAAKIAALGDRLEALGATLESVRSDTTTLYESRDSVTSRLDGLEARVGEITEQLAAIETRLSAVEKLAPESTEAAKVAAEAYARELAALRERFEGELAEIDAAQAQASALEAQIAESSKAAVGRAALAKVEAALDTGEPFEDALLELREATGLDAPEALRAVAAKGVPVLADLQADFPAAARAAIEADIRKRVEDGSMSKLDAFLKLQLGTRTLEPIEGDSADAVLSRAEAALKTGDLDTVLAELDTLPDAAKPAFAEWRARAEMRANALAAGKLLSEQLNAK